MKAVVETVGDIMLFDVLSGSIIPHNRPAVLESGAFLQQQLALGQLVVHASGLPDEATDVEWAEWWKSSEGDLALAIESFKSKFEVPQEPPVPEEMVSNPNPAGGRRNKGAA